jgi:SAM-dependent methyltransferase
VTTTPEFDQYAAGGYSRFLYDPFREKFAGSQFFVERKFHLLTDLCRQFGIHTSASRWLDVGCGQGELLALGQQRFSEVVGCDISSGMIDHCKGLDVRVQLSPREIPFESNTCDLVTAVCVYHHVAIPDRLALTADIVRVLKSGGVFCIIEHNPFNPVTQMIVRRSPIDTQAQLLTAREARTLAQIAHLEILATRYFLYFPEKFYSKMAAVEARLSALPLGGQYAVFCRKV